MTLNARYNGYCIQTVRTVRNMFWRNCEVRSGIKLKSYKALILGCTGRRGGVPWLCWVRLNAPDDRLAEDAFLGAGGAGINGYRFKGALSAHPTGGALYRSEVHPEPDVRTVIAAVGRED